MAYANPGKLEEWDPMTKSYQDANINSYESGPGVNLTPYTSPPANPEYKLYVAEIPVELNETGIRQVFSRYGNVLNVMSLSGTGWAFVTYGSFREAETAIRELNKKEPLNLVISFSRKKETKLPNNQNNAKQHGNPSVEPIPFRTIRSASDNQRPIEYISPEQRLIRSRQMVPNLERGKDLAALARRAIAPPPRHMYHETDDLLYPAIHDPNLYDPYEDAEPFQETNNMWARGRLQVSNNGHRIVAMGRGSTWYELPTPHPRVHQQVRSVYENREAGLYEYGENKLVQQIGKCQNCAQSATMRCQRCREFYCSRVCQENDWPRHKIECQAMPPLEGGPDSASLSMSSGDEVPPQIPIKRSIRSKLRRPLIAAPSLTVPNSTSTPVSGVSPILEMSVGIPEKTPIPREKENEPVLSQHNSIAKRHHTGNEKRASEKTTNTGVWNPIQNDNDMQPLRSCNNQAKNLNQKFNSVQGLNKTSLQGNESHPHQGTQINKNLFKRHTEQKNDQQINEQIRKLNLTATEVLKPTRKPLLSDPDFSFHRTTEVPEIGNFKIPHKVSFQGQETDLVPGTSGTGNHHSGKNDMRKNSPVKSEPKDQPAGITSPTKAKEGAKNIVQLLDVKEEGCFEAHVLLGANKAAVTVCVEKFQEEYEKILTELTPECETTPKPFQYQSATGDFVCGKRLDDWIRGTVQSLGPPMRLSAVDEGRIESVTDIKPVPQRFATMPKLGAICELTKGDFKLEAMAQYTFMVLNKNSERISQDGVEIVLFSADEKEGKGFLKPWIPAPEQQGVPYATLKSGTEICLTSFRSHVLIFVRSLVPEQLEIYNRVLQDIARCATKAPKLTELPIIGEIVIAKYAEDGNFYRAIVRKINDSKITVSYVDYGNIETTVLENLRQIDDKLKKYPSCAAKIVLKDVPKDVAMTKEVYKYLAMLTGSEKPLMCTFEGSPSTDGVILKAADGTSVNQKIIELLTPSWKKEEDKTSVFMVTDLEVAELGAVGTTSNVVVLSSLGPLMHAMAPQDLEHIEHVTGVMTAQMEEYCKQLKENYIPRVDELCLAPYQGLWYRAVCLSPNTTTTEATVHFIDFGNVEDIPHTDLRFMAKDFMNTKALASICTVVGLGPVDENGKLSPAVEARIMELIPENDIVLVRIIEFEPPNHYVVELPEVHEILVKEGLIKL